MDNTQLIINMYSNGIGIDKIASILNVTRLDIYRYLDDNNINWKDTKYSERDSQVCLLYSNGVKITKIAENLNINRHTVTNILKRNNVYKETNAKDKINSDSKKERNEKIIDLYNKGFSVRNVAKKLDICASTVTNVLKHYDIKARPAHAKGHSKGTSKNRKHFFNLNFFETIDTEEKAYWLGMLYADGYVTYKGTVSLALQKNDVDHIKRFRSVINADSVKLQDKKRVNAYALNLGSVKMSTDLIRLGCKQAKSLILEFPTENQVPKHLIHHFMRGYFDGDGCIYTPDNKSQCMFSVLGTNEFLNKYEKILLENIDRDEPNKRIHKDNWNDNTESIAYGGRNQILKIYNFLYKDATIYLERKYDKFNKILPSLDEITEI